jgi:polyphosphate kinase
MEGFKPYGNQVPTKVREIRINVESVIEKVYDDLGDFTEVETENLIAYAVVEDQDGNIMAQHEADYQRLISLGLMTTQQLQTIQTFIQNFRDSVEASILAP